MKNKPSFWSAIPRALLLGLVSLPALASSSELTLRAEATATWLFIDVYKAALYAPEKVGSQQLLQETTPLNLELCYLRAISKEQFVEAASKALPEDLSPELKAAVQGLHQAYQNVEPNDCYQLRYEPQQGVQLSLNQQPLFQTATAGFKQLYFGVWLGPNALSEKVRDQLLTEVDKPVSNAR
ncbi:MAG: chalcone isomerase family protein [Thiotrichales bacterium]|nr:chalcone isomerase family protein [Thiotrichales bacterium]